MNLAMSDNEDGNEDNDDSDSDMVELTHEDNEAAKDELSVSEFKKYFIDVFQTKRRKGSNAQWFSFFGD